MTGTVRVLGAVLVLAVAGFAVTTIPGVRQPPGFDQTYDGWLQGSCYVLIALLVALRPVARTVNRPLWVLLAVAIGLRAAGFVLYLAVVRQHDPAPYPSVADAAWLASSVVLGAGLWQQLRFRLPRLSLALVLDAVLGALVVSAVVVALSYGALVELARPGAGPGVVAVNLAYPLLDTVLLILVTGALVLMRWRLSRAEYAVAAGVVAIAGVDVVFLYQVTAGTYRPGTPLAALSLLGTAAFALAAWLPRPRAAVPASEGPRGLLLPAALALLCVLTLLYDTVARVPLATNLLAAGGIGVAIVRGVVTVTQDRREATVAMDAKQLELRRFRALVETSGDFIAIADLDGRMVYVNPAGRRLVGLAPDFEVGGLAIGDLLSEESDRHWREVRRPAVLQHGHWEGESQLRAAGGGPPIPVAISSFLIPHPSTGDPWLMATVQVDISERVAAEQAVQHLADQRKVLLGHLVQAEEAERARIAADVHDDSVQAMAAVELRLELLHQQAVARAPDLVASVETVRDTVRGATDRLRHLLFDLESPAQRSDLATALGEAAAFVFEDTVGWTVRGEVEAPEETRVTAYRIVKEAMVNVRKHAEAGRVEIRLRGEDGGIEVTVEDDGRGLGSDALVERPGHLGLTNMRDRATVAGGSLLVEPGAAGGTVVRLWLPTRWNGADTPDGHH